jgi:predicted phosphodiesterase
VRVAALYDIHGNLPALEAVLADSRCATADVVVCGGDLVAGPMPRECLERLLALGTKVHFVRGNGDRQVAEGDDDASRWCRGRLGPELTAEVHRWPLTLELNLALGRTTFAHATLRSDDEIVTRITPPGDVAAALGDVGGTIVVGHTHVQFDRRLADRRLVNAGSVGMPYEGRTGAFWALLGSDVELLETAYDVEAAARAIRETRYPFASDAAETILSPSTAEEATKHFESLRGA